MVWRRKRSERSVDGLYFISTAEESVHQTFDYDFNFVSRPKYWEYVAVGGIIN